jgi:hypothetical protein
MPMRRLLLVVLLLGAAAGPAYAADRDFPNTGFDKVDLAAAAEVDVHTGGPFAVHARGDPKWLDLLNIRVVQGTLVIGWDRQHINMNGHDPIHIRVSMPRISGATISGAGTIDVDRAEAPDFAAAIKGAGTIQLSALHAARAHFEMGGAGKITAAGTAGSVDARVGGFGALELAGLAARAGRFDMAGTGSIKARVDGPADVAMNGVGSVDVGGNPRCSVHKSGLGSVRCGG